MKRFRNTPKMFSKITSMFHSQPTEKHLRQTFIAHWKAITNFFMENKDHHVNVDQTTLPRHLDQMIQILVEEENESESGLTGPCLEYLLHHKALDTLYSLARSDCPPGMKQVVLQFFTKILSRIKQPILPHVNVYKPVQKLVCLCGEVSASPAEQEEVQFICVLCAKLKTSPYLVNFFIQSAKNTASPSHVMSNLDNKLTNASDSRIHFKILEALLSLMASNDSWVSVKACEAMMLCASLPEPVSVQCLLSSTFIECITSKLCTLYSKLPKVMDPAQVECIQAKWGWDFLCDTGDEVRFMGKRQLISFMSWLDYCDQLVGMSQPEIGEKLADSIHKNFMIGLLQPAILQTSENGAITATSHLCQCVHLVSSELLLNEFVYFILGCPSNDNQNDLQSEICDRLIDRCNHLCEELSIATLKLFEALLSKQHPYILDTLVLQYLVNRSYVDFDKLPAETLQEQLDSDLETDDESLTLSIDLPSPVPIQSASDKINQSPDMNSAEGNPLSSLNVVSADGDQLNSTPNSPATSSTVTNVSLQSAAVITNESSCSGTTLPKEQQPLVNSEWHSQPPSSMSESTDQPEEESSTDRNQAEEESSTDSNQPEEESSTDRNQPEEESSIDRNQPEEESSTDRNQPEEESSTDSNQPLVSSAEEIDHSPVMSLVETELEDQLRVHTIVNSFLSILEEDCQSSCQLDDTGYETYLREAHRQFVTVSNWCRQYNWPQKPIGNPQSHQQFDEGPFLTVLLDRISHMLDQSYDVNLHVTSVVSKLALVPHPNLHEYLLDPMLPVKTGCRTLYKILEKVALVIKTRVKPIPDYHKKLIAIRKQLIGFSDTYRRRSVGEDNQCLEHANALTGVIILEEFCKELAAIAFVKYHEITTQL